MAFKSDLNSLIWALDGNLELDLILEVDFAHYWRNVFVEQLTLHSVVCRIYPLTNGECQHHDTSLPRSQPSRVQTPSSTFPIPIGYQLVCITTALPLVILLLPLYTCHPPLPTSSPCPPLLPLCCIAASLPVIPGSDS